MHGIAAKIAEEIVMLLQHGDGYSGPRQQVAEHHPRRPTAYNTACGFVSFVRHRRGLF